ncbi:MAG TPA: flagellar hook-basal body complex protein FliE [Bauldia sp.]|nr:flagellar hook-basal body complex protein FliE [Bauldia sp.]
MLVTGIGGLNSITRVVTPGSSAAPTAPAAGDFGKVLADVAGSAMDALKAGESTAIAGVQGKASTQQVVESVMTAEQALQTAIAVRDKLISAYQEISRMPI